MWHRRSFVLALPPWRQGDALSHGQSDWDEVGAGPVEFYGQVYASRFGVLEVGIPGAAGHSIAFVSSNGVLAYLPASSPW